MDVEAVILAAGLGTRLGRPHPKPLTRLRSGETIIEQQVAHLRAALGERTRITAVVGFKLDLVIEANPDLSFAYNERYDVTGTSKSLLKAFRVTGAPGVLWLDGDVVFGEHLLVGLRPHLDRGTSFTCTRESGEPVGINYVSRSDKAVMENRLSECADQDSYRRAVERAREHDGLELTTVDVTRYDCVAVDVAADLDRANAVRS